MWESSVNGRKLNFHLAGINNQNFIMRDEQTGTWWQQVTGEAIQGALAGRRLGEVASTFTELATGAAFLKQYPDDPNAAAVKKRLESLAQNLYGEVVLYQDLGDHVKALDRIQDILENAPLTAAAEALRQRLLPEDSEGSACSGAPPSCSRCRGCGL